MFQRQADARPRKVSANGKMMNNLEIETKLIQRFVIQTKRDRFLTFIKNDKTRQKFINELYHADFFQEELFDKIVQQENEIIKDRIKHLHNTKTCYVISTNTKIDGKIFDIETSLSDTISAWADEGTLIIFGDAEIVYREAEGPKNKWISRRTKFI